MIIGNALYSYKEDYIKEHPQLNKIHKWDVDSLYNLQKYNTSPSWRNVFFTVFYKNWKKVLNS